MPNVNALLAIAAVLSIWSPLVNAQDGDPQLPQSTATAPIHFDTLRPGAQLPSDAECAALVRPAPETIRKNAPYNQTPGNQPVAADFFHSGDPRANTEIATRITGNYTGTPSEILQWVACKWGIDEDLVKAQAMQESGWVQPIKGDYSSRAIRCAPGHEIGKDGRSTTCPESWGIMQVKYYFYQSTWPAIVESTAYNADVAVSVWRACFEGYEKWLNNIPHGQEYAAGDMWGCIGRWYSGQWHTPRAERYISIVQRRLARHAWRW